MGNPTTLICVAGVRADERPFRHCASKSLIFVLPQVRPPFKGKSLIWRQPAS